MWPPNRAAARSDRGLVAFEFERPGLDAVDGLRERFAGAAIEEDAEGLAALIRSQAVGWRRAPSATCIRWSLMEEGWSHRLCWVIQPERKQHDSYSIGLGLQCCV